MRLVAVLFNRLCEMHLETESDGDSDFVAPFSYNPGKFPNSQSDFRTINVSNVECHVKVKPLSLKLSLFLSRGQRGIVQRKIQMSAAVLTDDAFVRTWVPCASVTQASDWIIRGRVV